MSARSPGHHTREKRTYTTKDVYVLTDSSRRMSHSSTWHLALSADCFVGAAADLYAVNGIVDRLARLNLAAR
jgi:uncharacterized protein (DUF58 family)